ncbi:5-formyltetrahydrofolate cyclo-ligase [Oceanispirochaeta crateris]|uniref:5-formyltetrahydrofolate cyclo-ligase n=1 Tax=Oceanispirochaeta crateris TaxID=2518645 RepID=A0A5C1QNP2_9SPIO|nr:5-formyltetrahydrofolate cyclo-ligase [Oceanispirochaeta crateris]QEN08839.1 5-formyltetrahydrofolate cyclo-ligase [Oceanispirochaeta crateris]
MKQLKSAMRKTLQARLDDLSKDEISRLSHTICNTVLGSSDWKEATVILAYLSFNQEISLDELVMESLQEGKAVFVPRIKDKAMEFHEIKSLDSAFLEINKWNIREPLLDSPRFDPETSRKVLMLVPALGFTREGIRMGRGGGYYDRYLERVEKNLNMTTMGICWEAVLMDEIPTEDHDKSVQTICCEDRLIRPHSLN